MKKLLIAVVLLLIATAAYANSPVGVVLSVNGEAYAISNNEEKLITAAGHAIYKHDEIITASDGRVQIMFIDNTTISISEDTILDVSVFEFDTKNEFAVDVTKGVVKLISGKIVEQNRDGFKVNTPQSTISIRGTVLTVGVQDDKTNVLINNISPEHNVNVTNKITMASTSFNTGGTVVTASTAGNAVRPATPQEMGGSENVPSGIGSDVSKSNPGKGNNKGNPGNSGNAGNQGNNPSLNTNNTAHYSGTASNAGWAPSASGNVSFKLDLGNNKISDFNMSLTGADNVTVTGATGNVYHRSIVVNADPSTVNVNGGAGGMSVWGNFTGNMDKANGGYNYWGGPTYTSGGGNFNATKD